MIVPLVAAFVIAAQTVPSSLPSASPAPPAGVRCGGRCLAGIAIGDDKYRVLMALDSRPLPGSDERIMGDFNGYPDGLMLAVYYQKTIVAVSITYVRQPGSSRIIDPYGIRLDDASERLTSLRGKPDTIDGNVWRYGAVDAIHWDYSIENGVVTTILLSSVAKLP
jgi:hypothetical protein